MAASTSRSFIRGVSTLYASASPLVARGAAAPLSQIRFLSSASSRSQDETDTRTVSSSSAAVPSPAPPVTNDLLPDTKYHPRTHGHHVCSLRLDAYFQAETLENLRFFTDFAVRAAYALGIPVSAPASPPRQHSLWTVIKGPFAHKKSQENFRRITCFRVIRVWDTNEEMIDKWLYFLRLHEMPGVGMRAEIFKRRPVGVGRKVFEEAKAALREQKLMEEAQGEQSEEVTQAADEGQVAENVQASAEDIFKEGETGGSQPLTDDEPNEKSEAKASTTEEPSTKEVA